MPVKIERITKKPKLVPYNLLSAGDVFRIVESDDPDIEHLKGELFLATDEGSVCLDGFAWFNDDDIMSGGYDIPKVEVLPAKLIIEE